MVIKVNGKEYEVSQDKLSITALLEEKKVDNPEMVSVQLNGAFVQKENYQSTELSEGDEVDFLYFMGGGA